MPQAGRLVRQPEEPVEGKAICMPFYASCLSGTAQSDKKDPGRPRKRWGEGNAGDGGFSDAERSRHSFAPAGPMLSGKQE